jgi:hypothetical protein
MWEKRPDESDKAYSAFLEFIGMPIRDVGDPDNSRTLLNLSKKLGYATPQGKAATTLEQWSTKYSWQERARAYDTHQSQLMIVVKDASLLEYQQEVIERRTEQTVLMNTALNAQLMDILRRQQAGEAIESLELLRTVNALKYLDDLERRIAGLPTNFSTQAVEDEGDNEVRKFVIGGSRE